MVVRFGADAECMVMTSDVNERLGFMKLYRDNKATINIAYNLVQPDRIKNIEIDRQFIKENLNKGTLRWKQVTGFVAGNGERCAFGVIFVIPQTGKDQLLLEAFQAGSAKGFVHVFGSYVALSEPGLYGLASISTVLNALRPTYRSQIYIHNSEIAGCKLNFMQETAIGASLLAPEPRPFPHPHPTPAPAPNLKLFYRALTPRLHSRFMQLYNKH
ncbi:hypothetical protein HYC85_009202 [Camellia sinensis]|uniref:Uncharacterized protein n=1 Tax=Camellia sinensis TaxID=4442 RepID=A0A7J7HGY8_CAMSI|nr:hypothetical protein HYC85_009202 [Camellia sinensis]